MIKEGCGDGNVMFWGSSQSGSAIPHRPIPAIAYTLPADFTTKGTTITEHVKHLEKQWQLAIEEIELMK